jgi:hypothetical protein
MSDQDLVFDTIQLAQRLLAEYVAPGPRRNPDETISMLPFLLDRRDVVAPHQSAAIGIGAVRGKVKNRRDTRN